MAKLLPNVTLPGFVVAYFAVILVAQLGAKLVHWLGFGSDLRFGTFMMFSVITMLSAVALIVILRASRQGWRGRHYFVLAGVVALIVVTYFYFPQFVPSIFSVGMSEIRPGLQSILP